MKTMNATTSTMTMISKAMAGMVKLPQACCLANVLKFCTARGRPTTMPAKISNDMPLPMPRSVICSPSHMMKMLPVVRVMIVSRMNEYARVEHEYPGSAG